MRSLSILATLTLASFSTVHAMLLPRQLNIPDCSKQCMTPGYIPYGNCAATDSTCLCHSKDYVQAALNCITSACKTQSDIDATLQVANALCYALQISTPPAGVTTAAPGEPKTSAAATTTSAAAAATTSKSAASAPIGVNQPLVLLGAAAVALGVAL